MSASHKPRPGDPRGQGSSARSASAPSEHLPGIPLDERDIEELQACLDRVPAPFEPLDVSMLDGFLCGVLLQPQPIPETSWLPHLTDADGRALPASFDATRLHELTRRRWRELDAAIARRQWFDPWVFEFDAEATDDQDIDGPATSEAVYPWVAGFATAQEFFPGLMRLDARAMTAPLALLYRHLQADDLEDAEELLEEIESLEPPADLAEAVEELVRATLLLADISRPITQPPGGSGVKPAGGRARPGATGPRGSGRQTPRR